MPHRRWLGAGAAVGGKLYVTGGYESDLDGGNIEAVRTTSVYAQRHVGRIRGGRHRLTGA